MALGSKVSDNLLLLPNSFLHVCDVVIDLNQA